MPLLGKRIEAGALLPNGQHGEEHKRRPATAINIHQLRFMCASVGARNTDTALAISLRCSLRSGLS